jgi:ribonuclease BN (tRNA processing enzyme)
LADLTLRTVGTGTAFPDGVRTPTCNLIQYDGFSLVVDLGSGSLHKLAQLGLDPRTISAVCITHAHFDHLTDLLPLLFALNVPGYERASDTPLTLVMSAETHRLLEGARAVFTDWLQPPPNKVRELVLQPGDSLELGPFSVDTAFPHHTSSSLGYRFTLQAGRRPVLAIPGDSGPCDALSALCRDADVAIMECSMPDSWPLPAHMTPTSLLDLAQAADIRHLLVTHRYPMVMDVDLPQRFEKAGRRMSLPDDMDEFSIPVH